MPFYRCNLVNGKCTNCGKLNPTTFPDKLVRIQCTSGPCIHLGEEKGLIKIPCSTCQGTVELKQVYNVCNISVKRYCLPEYVPPNLQEWESPDRYPENEMYALCRLCPKFTNG